MCVLGRGREGILGGLREAGRTTEEEEGIDGEGRGWNTMEEEWNSKGKLWRGEEGREEHRRGIIERWMS